MIDRRQYQQRIAEALAKERELRDAAFIGVNSIICGVEVRQMTLRDRLILASVGSPFLCGGIPAPEDVAQFLWVLSPAFERLRRDGNLTTWRGRLSRWIFTFRLRRLKVATLDAAITEYLDATFLDEPPEVRRSPLATVRPPRVSYAAAYTDAIGERYGWAVDETLDTPLCVLFQLDKRIAICSDPKAVTINKLSDKARREYMLAKREAKKAGANAL